MFFTRESLPFSKQKCHIVSLLHTHTNTGWGQYHLVAGWKGVYGYKSHILSLYHEERSDISCYSDKSPPVPVSDWTCWHFAKRCPLYLDWSISGIAFMEIYRLSVSLKNESLEVNRSTVQGDPAFLIRSTPISKKLLQEIAAPLLKSYSRHKTV